MECTGPTLQRVRMEQVRWSCLTAAEDSLLRNTKLFNRACKCSIGTSSDDSRHEDSLGTVMTRPATTRWRKLISSQEPWYKYQCSLYRWECGARDAVCETSCFGVLPNVKSCWTWEFVSLVRIMIHLFQIPRGSHFYFRNPRMPRNY